MAKSAALRLSVSKVGLRLQQIHLAVEQPPGLVVVGRHQLVEAYRANDGSFTSGESEAVRFVGPMDPATNRGRAGCARWLPSRHEPR